MNQKERKKEVEDNRKLYRIPSGANYQLRSKNAVYISPSNTLRHELAKSIGAYMLRKYGDIKFLDTLGHQLEQIEKTVKTIMKEFPKDKSDFITECVPKREPERRVDLVRLSDNTRFEFETKSNIKKNNCITIYI